MSDQDAQPRNGEFMKFLKEASLLVGILVPFSLMLWFMLKQEILPVKQSQIRIEANILSLHEWQRIKGEDIAAMRTRQEAQIERIRRLESYHP